MPDVLTYYLNKIEKLRIGRSHGKPAPHKPILLLALIDLFEEGAITKNEIEPSPQIVESFLKYWHLVSLEKPRIFLPFFHLKSDKFWHLHAKAGNKKLLAMTKQMNSMTHLASLVEFASLDEDLFLLLHRADAREAIRQKIIEVYFGEQTELFRAVIADNREINNIEHLLLESAEKENPEIARTVTDTPKRNIAFRRAIIRLYNYTCAACRLRIITLDGETAVEAAHIFPFAQSYDDSIGNGISLCPLHHWAFDKHLFSIDDNYKMIVSSNFEESGNEAFSLHSLQAKEIYLPKEKPFRPSISMLRWHRGKLFS
ncbi:MAG TPA: HNH endonuclease [Pyrinomonadaceae bacterium]|nr:HNH endonuclease [Pyrinomonadaceae bacterium]